MSFLLPHSNQNLTVFHSCSFVSLQPFLTVPVENDDEYYGSDE